MEKENKAIVKPTGSMECKRVEIFKEYEKVYLTNYSYETNMAEPMSLYMADVVLCFTEPNSIKPGDKFAISLRQVKGD